MNFYAALVIRKFSFVNLHAALGIYKFCAFLPLPLLPTLPLSVPLPLTLALSLPLPLALALSLPLALLLLLPLSLRLGGGRG